MSSSMLVLPLQGRGYINSTLTQVVDMYGTEVPMKISKTSVDFDALTINGVSVTATGTLEVADITDLTASAAELNILDGVTASAAELNVLDGIAATLTAAELSILDGVTATAAEINSVDISLNTETIAEGGVVSVTKAITKIASTGAGAVTLAAPDATMLGKVKIIEMISGEHDVTLALTNVQGGSAGTSALFSDINDAFMLVAGVGKWHVIGESGVVLS